MFNKSVNFIRRLNRENFKARNFKFVLTFKEIGMCPNLKESNILYAN